MSKLLLVEVCLFRTEKNIIFIDVLGLCRSKAKSAFYNASLLCSGAFFYVTMSAQYLLTFLQIDCKMEMPNQFNIIIVRYSLGRTISLFVIYNSNDDVNWFGD